MRTINRFLLFIIFSALVISANSVNAQEQTETQDSPSVVQQGIAIINAKGILQNSTAYKSTQKQINEYRSSIQNIISKEDEQLRKARQELSMQRNVLSPEAYAGETRKFEDRVSEAQRVVQLRRQELEQFRNKAMSEIDAILNKIVTEIASERKISIVLRKEQIFLAAKYLDITEEVVKRLNDILPDTTVPQLGN